MAISLMVKSALPMQVKAHLFLQKKQYRGTITSQHNVEASIYVGGKRPTVT